LGGPWDWCVVEAIGEVFNLFNAINPANFERTVSSVNQTVRLVGGAENPNYMQPSRFAGDFQQPPGILSRVTP
jgi:hypothetical protein